MLSVTKLKDPAVKVTLLGLTANAGMALGKGIGGVVFNSQSLIADAMHASSDLISDFLTLSTVSLAKRRPTTNFPNGFGRIEALGAFGVSSMLIIAGLSMGYSSLTSIFEAMDIHAFSVPVGGHSHLGHTHSHLPAEWSAAYIALASIGIKEVLYQVTERVAKQQNSPVLHANAWHHRLDCLVSVVSVASISLGQVLQTAWLDPLGGLLVSMMVVKAGYQPLKTAALELMGSIKPALDSKTMHLFTERCVKCLESSGSNYTLKNCYLEPYGSNYLGIVELKDVDSNLEQVAADLKRELVKIEHVSQVQVRV